MYSHRQPSLGYVDLTSVSEYLRGSIMETRKRAPSEILNEEEVNTERELFMLGVGELDIQENRGNVEMSCKT